MLAYLVEVHICWGIMWLFYKLSLSRETYFHVNRWYLATSFLLGLIIPLIKVSQLISTTALFEVDLSGVGLPEITVGSAPSQGQILDISFLIWIVYWIVAGVLLLRLFAGLMKIWYLYSSGEHKRESGFLLISHDRVRSPFSFFNCLFISSRDTEGADFRVLLLHEKTHIRSWHSLDVLFMEIAAVFFWYSPLVWLYRKELQDVHEYEADASVIRKFNPLEYAKILLGYLEKYNGKHPVSSIPLFGSQLKRRFMMMKRNPSNTRSLAKYLLVILILLLMILMLSLSGTSQKVSSYTDVNQEQSVLYKSDTLPEDIYTRVEQMPQYKNGEADLMQFIGENLRYTNAAREQGHQGTVIVRFVVKSDGSLSDYEVIRSVHETCDDEVLRVLDLMKPWQPDMQDGKPVNVRFTLPVKFRLEGF